MEAVPRLPMLSFDLKVSPEATSFGPKLKQVTYTATLQNNGSNLSLTAACIAVGDDSRV